MECKSINFQGRCCDSCHEDSEDLGIYGCTIFVIVDGEEKEIEVCCKAQTWYEEQERLKELKEKNKS